MFLALSSFQKFELFQMDVKSTFLNGDLEEEVYIEQPDGFILGNDPNLVCRLKKDLYGIKQAPRAWYYRLDKYLHQQGFSKGSADSNIYIKIENDKLLILIVYVDDIIFGNNEEAMSQSFALVMQKEFELSLLGELTYFLGLQIQQNEDGIFLSQSEFMKVMQYKFTKEIWDKIVLSYKGDYYELGHASEEEEESNFVQKLQQGTGRFRGKLPFKCFACGRVSHYAAKCLHKDKGKEPVRWNKKLNANKKSYYTHEDSDGLSNSDEDERGNNYKLLMDFEDDDYMDAIDVDGFYEEISRLKTCLEEKNMIIDTLQIQLDEKEQSLKKLECGIIGLRKEIEKTKALNLKFVKGSETLDEIIKVQCSPLIKTGLGYNGETSQASTSKSYLDAARRYEQKPNEDHQVKQGRIPSRINKDYQVNQGQFSLRMNRSYNQPQVRSSQSTS